MQLSRPARATGADTSALWQVRQPTVPAVHQHVTRIASRQDGAKRQSVRQPRGQVLQAVYGHVQVPGQQAFLDLAYEHAEAHSGQRGGLIGVAAGTHDDDLQLQAGMMGPELRQGLLVLDQRQGTAPAADTDRAVGSH